MACHRPQQQASNGDEKEHVVAAVEDDERAPLKRAPLASSSSSCLTAKGLFCSSRQDDAPISESDFNNKNGSHNNTSTSPSSIRERRRRTRTGTFEGQRLTFEWQTAVTPPLPKTQKKRPKPKAQLKNIPSSPLELRIRWWLFGFSLTNVTALYISSFVLVNLIFGALFCIPSGKCCNDPSLTFWHNFDFALQTSTTMGYGGYDPYGAFSKVLVVVLGFITLVLNVVYAGLLFLKYIRPTAKIEFSQVMTLSNIYDHMPFLEFRIGNADGANNPLQDVQVKCTFTYILPHVDEMAGEACELAQTQDLALMTSHRPQLDNLVWTLRHVVDESSPLFGLRLDQYPGNLIHHFVVSVNATQYHTQCPMFLHHTYWSPDVQIGYRFQDQITVLNPERTQFVVDYSKMSQVRPYPVWYPTMSAGTSSNKSVGNGSSTMKGADDKEVEM